jgi:hypothetical protein
MGRDIECLYCGERRRQGREHVVPKWLWRELVKVGYFVAPGRGRHAFGGNKKIPDVCATCNSGPLSQLDEAAKTWWTGRGQLLDPVLDAHPPTIGRWCAKIAVNMERAEAEQDRVGTWTPRIPMSVKQWVINGGSAPSDIVIRAAALPADHHFALDGGIYGSGDRTMGARVLQLLGVMFYVAWHFPLDPTSQSIAQIIAYLDQYHPSVRLDLDEGTGPVKLPLVPRPDELTLGIYDDPILLAKVRTRIAKEESVR